MGAEGVVVDPPVLEDPIFTETAAPHRPAPGGRSRFIRGRNDAEHVTDQPRRPLRRRAISPRLGGCLDAGENREIMAVREGNRSSPSIPLNHNEFFADFRSRV